MGQTDGNKRCDCITGDSADLRCTSGEIISSSPLHISPDDEIACSMPDSQGIVRPLLKKPLYFWIRLALGSIFVFASLDKILHPEAFAKLINNYQILPDSAVNLTAIILPWLELILGFLLITGLWLPGSVVLADLLLVAFFCGLVSAAARGLDIHCGCFSTSDEEKPRMLWYFLRDSAFLSLGGYLLYKTFFPRLSRKDSSHASISSWER